MKSRGPRRGGMSPGRPGAARSVGRRGFALIITITLLAFLVLLLVSLASLTRVETRVAGNNQQLAQARQNALMALNIALGQLQKHAGPDQRVTGEADVLASYTGHPALPASASGTAAAQTDIDAFWNAQRNRHWTGVWRNTNTTVYSAGNPAASNATAGLQAWLVSGNEQAATFTPDATVSGLSLTSTALDEIKDAAGNPYRLLVGANSTAASDPATDLQRLVIAPQVSIASSGVPGVSGSVPIGHYAWWVGDEGVKARANLRDAHVDDTSDAGKRKRLQSAQRVAIEAMSTNGVDGLAADYPANDPLLANVFAMPQLGLLDSAADFQTQLKTRFHDLTTSSKGVLADVKNGGLKHDLSYLLSRPAEADFRTALNVALPGAAPGGSYNPILSTACTPYAELPGGSFAGMLDYSATWEQLWSFHNLGNLTTASPAGVFNVSGQAVPRLHAGAQHGLSPLLVQGKVFYNLRNGEGGTVWIDIMPVVVLANPYNVDLAPADYYFEITGIPLLFQRMRATNSPLTNNGVVEQFYLSNIGLQETVLVLRTQVIPAGEARIFAVSGVDNPIIADTWMERVVVDGTASGVVYMTNGYDGQTCLTLDTHQVLSPPTSGLTYGQMAKLSVPNYPAIPTVTKELRFRIYLASDKTKHSNLAHQGLHLLPNSPSIGNFSAKVLDGSLTHDRGAEPLRGGGIYFSYFDGARRSPSHRQNNEAPSAPKGMFHDKQALFYQGNYRALLNQQHGTFSSPYTPPNVPFALADASYNEAKHPPAFNQATSVGNDEWINAFIANAGTGAVTEKVRWGLAFLGKDTVRADTITEMQKAIPAPSGFEGAGAYLSDRAMLYDIPRSGHPITSLGQLQHLNTTGHIPASVTTIDNKNTVHSWQANYALGNSYPHHRVARDQVFNADNYDGSYLWNDALWDRFTFSSYPGSDPFDFATDTLVNARYRPFRDRSAVAWDDETQFRGDSRSAAKNLLVEGAFNINSTSVEAWKAVFSSLKNVPVGSETASSAPFARTLYQTGGSAGAKTGMTADAWTGFRDLSATEINQLAAEMVMQVRKRGPFLSMADFVNRRLAATAGDTHNLGLSGALQAAIDGVVNLASHIGTTGGYPFNTQTAAGHLAEDAYRLPSRIAGFPGYLLQGDVLSALAPTLTARSDTFTIRTYGDVVNPATGEIEGRAWCEAVVQRTPDYVVPLASGGNAPEEIPAAGSINATFGRRYEMISFRWLSPEDI